MAFVTYEKLFSKSWFRAYTLILFGSFIIALGYVLFITPYKIVPGGVYGICIILHHTLGVPVGLMALAFNIPLTILAIRVLGPRYGAKTITGFLLTSFFLDGLTFLLGNDPLNIGDEVLMSSVYGGVVIGIGVGLLFKARASCGGTDVVAMMLSKFTKLPVGQLMIYVDSVIVIGGLAAFGIWKIPLYSWITIFVLGKVVDTVMQGISFDKCLLIVSEKYREIGEVIVKDIHRGGTFLNGQGLYNGKERKLIFSVMNRREMALLESYIKNIDPMAFITVIDANEILGEGFKSLDEKLSD
jgi:uncharacterized membrane-anchored protein YitT (DUF2179 family)